MNDNTDQISIRIANGKDCDRLFEWIQDPVVSRSGFTTHEISRHEHEQWFAERQADEDTSMFMGYLGDSDSPIGHIRFESAGDSAEVSVILDRSHRGQGLGTALIRTGTLAYLQSVDTIDRVVAKIKEDNDRSKQAFENAGYTYVKKTEVKGRPAVIYELTS